VPGLSVRSSSLLHGLPENFWIFCNGPTGSTDFRKAHLLLLPFCLVTVHPLYRLTSPFYSWLCWQHRFWEAAFVQAPSLHHQSPRSLQTCPAPCILYCNLHHNTHVTLCCQRDSTFPSCITWPPFMRLLTLRLRCSNYHPLLLPAPGFKRLLELRPLA
jgi:hypothetical protein